MNFNVGDVWTPKFTTRDPESKVAVKPASVTAKLTKPDGSEEAVALTEIATGVFKPRIKLTVRGTWKCKIFMTGEYEGVKTAEITVRP